MEPALLLVLPTSKKRHEVLLLIRFGFIVTLELGVWRVGGWYNTQIQPRTRRPLVSTTRDLYSIARKIKLARCKGQPYGALVAT
jgi:hypothetical protein